MSLVEGLINGHGQLTLTSRVIGGGAGHGQLTLTSRVIGGRYHLSFLDAR